MLKNPVPVSQASHRYKRLLPIPSYAFARTQAIVPLLAAEIAQAIHNFPIVFAKHGEAFVLMGLLSLRPESNLFVTTDGKWLGSYIPACLRQYPFAIGLPAEGGEPVLCADEGSGLISDTDGQPLFGVDGTPTETLRKAMEFVSEMERNRAITIRAVNALTQHDLIVPWELKLQGPAGAQQVEGLFRVDEVALNALSGEAFLELRAAGALPLAYAHLLSLNCIEVLTRLLAAQNQAAQPAQTSSTLAGAIDRNGDLVFNF